MHHTNTNPETLRASNATLPIGELIRQEFEKMPRSCTVTWFARLLKCDRTNVYDIFTRQSIDTGLLMRISCILNHDFFADYTIQYMALKEREEFPVIEIADDDDPSSQRRRGRSRKSRI